MPSLLRSVDLILAGSRGVAVTLETDMMIYRDT